MEKRSTRMFGDVWESRYVLVFGTAINGGRGVLAMYHSLADCDGGQPPIKNRLIDVRRLRLLETLPGKVSGQVVGGAASVGDRAPRAGRRR